VTVTSGSQTTDPIACSAGVTVSLPIVITFCDTVTDVSKSECEALMDIYDTNGGTDWTADTGWGTSTTVCSWFGVTCDAGEDHVTFLDLPNNNMSGAFGLSQGNLNVLSGLDLSGNNLSSFIGTRMSALASLDLSNNQLTSFSGS